MCWASKSRVFWRLVGSYSCFTGDGLAPEERQVLKELRSVLGLPREAQRAKLKELLMRLHPDKNPQQADKASTILDSTHSKPI